MKHENMHIQVQNIHVYILGICIFWTCIFRIYRIHVPRMEPAMDRERGKAMYVNPHKLQVHAHTVVKGKHAHTVVKGKHVETVVKGKHVETVVKGVFGLKPKTGLKPRTK